MIHIFIIKECNYSLTHHSDPLLHSMGSQLGAGWFHCGIHTLLWWKSRCSLHSNLCSDRCDWCRCSHMADTLYPRDTAVLEDDRRSAMHEWMKNTSTPACAFVIPLSTYGRSCAFSSWCRLDVYSRLPHTLIESHTGDPCSAGLQPTWCHRTALEWPAKHKTRSSY